MTKPVTIIRTQHGKENPYFQMSRATAQNRELTWEARGMMSYFLSKPDDWDIKISDLQQKCGRDKVNATIKELEQAGYLRKERDRRPDGTYGAVAYRVYEHPLTENPLVDEPLTGKPSLADPHVDEPLLAKPHLHNIEYTDKRESQNTENKTDSAPRDAAQNVPVPPPPQIPDSPVGEKTTAAKKKSTASANPEENKAVAELIKSWLDASGTIQANAYGNKTNRALAIQMHQKGVTPVDITTLIKDLRGDDFWKDKPISLTKVAERIVAWKEAAQHIPPEHIPWVPPPERADYVDPQIVLMQNKQMAKMLRLQRNAAVVPNG